MPVKQKQALAMGQVELSDTLLLGHLTYVLRDFYLDKYTTEQPQNAT